MSYEPPRITTPYDDDGNGPNSGDIPPSWLHTHPLPLDAQPLYPLDHDGYNAMSNHDGHVEWCGDAYELDNGTASAEPEPDSIEWLTLTQEFELMDQRRGDWAIEMEEMVLDPQGEYTRAMYSPPPDPPPPTSWYPPQPPTSDYTRPRAHYRPPHVRYRPPRTHYTSQRPPYHPCTRPAPRQHPRIETRERHVTATRRVQNRGPAGSNQTEPLQYVPPALQSNNRASWRSQLPNPHLSKNSRDPPPHKDPPAQNPKRSDSPDWGSPSPNHPISFRNPSPPQSPPAPPASPLLTPETPQTTQQYHLESQLGSELITLIKVTSEALRSIA
jgi:hypothetical protein